MVQDRLNAVLLVPKGKWLPGEPATEGDYISNLEARTVTLYIFSISEHTRFTYIPFVLAPVLFPLCHVIKARGKLFASNSFNDLFAAVTENLNCFNSGVRRGFN